MKRNNYRPKKETLRATPEQMRYAINKAQVVVENSAPWKGAKKMNKSQIPILKDYVTKSINVSALLFTGKLEEIAIIEEFGLSWIKGDKNTGKFYFKDLNTGRKILVCIGQYIVINKNGTIITPCDHDTFKNNFILNSNSES